MSKKIICAAAIGWIVALLAVAASAATPTLNADDRCPHRVERGESGDSGDENRPPPVEEESGDAGDESAAQDDCLTGESMILSPKLKEVESEPNQPTRTSNPPEITGGVKC